MVARLHSRHKVIVICPAGLKVPQGSAQLSACLAGSSLHTAHMPVVLA